MLVAATMVLTGGGLAWGLRTGSGSSPNGPVPPQAAKPTTGAALLTSSSAAAGAPATASSPKATGAVSPVVKLAATADTYVVHSRPTAVQGARGSLFATKSENRAFLRFDTKGAVPQGKRVVGASLMVYVLNSTTSAAGFQIHPVVGDWDERTLKAANRPPYVARSLCATARVPAKRAWLTVPLTDVSTIRSDGSTSFELLHLVSGSRLQLASRESGKAAQLQLQLADVVPSGGATPSPTVPLPVPASSGVRPFDLPAVATLAASKKLAFAHYFTPFPISIDNKAPSQDYYARNYLDPKGEHGKHASYAGLLRDRPLGRAPLSGNWQATDMETEVRQARSAGLDGFAVDILSLTSYNWDRTVELLEAAHRVDPSFKIMLMPDMTTLDDESPASLARAMKTLGTYPAAFHLADGRLVVSPFKAEAKSAAWWKSWLATMSSTQGVTVAFVPTILDWQAHADDFASISYGFSHWGLSSPATNEDAAKHAKKAHAMGKIFMAPAKVQDVRPSQGQYQEAGNTETLRLSWQGIIDGDADWVDIPTWNDYSEGTSVAPSAQHGWAYLDLMSYYLAKWKTGSTPAVVRDGLFVSHRNQKHDATAQVASAKPMVLRSGSTAARDTVEVFAFLTEAATVTVKVGSATYTWPAPAGVHSRTFPLQSGTVSAMAVRDGRTTTAVTSPYTVQSRPLVQDLQYDAVSSLRP